MSYTILIFILCFLLNIFMGMWRVQQRKFSVQWFIAIHAPVPVIILLRLCLGVSYTLIPLLIIVSIAGQMIGGMLFMLSAKKR